MTIISESRGDVVKKILFVVLGIMDVLTLLWLLTTPI